ncbi:MAG: methyl-accepting chemotaxis protein [Acetobacteraceae bacterium]
MLIVTVGVGIAAILGISLNIQWNAMYSGRVDGLKSLTEMAAGIAERYRQQSVEGHITEAEAKTRALADISAMRYGNGDYFFVTDDNSILLAHPNKSLIGGDRKLFPDVNGFNYTTDVMPRVMRDGVGVVRYVFGRQGSGEPVPKVAVYRHYAAWGWVIGDGAYIDDLTTVFWSSIEAMLLAAAAVMAVIFSVAFVIMRSITRPLAGLQSTMQVLASGDTSVEVRQVALKDEVGAMAGAVQVFKESMIRAAAQAATEAAAEAERQATRRQGEAEREAIAAQQETVVTGLASGLAALAKGDLTATLDTPFAPEYEALRTDFNATVSQLQAVIRQIVANTQTIRLGTDEITQAADDLSRRTEQQAASLEQTAAALDEITATIRKTAEGANTAQGVASAAKSDAEHSSQVVHDAVRAMGEIEASAQQISQIIGVIDEIAFQTNLLALNAGVEAARAGDAGRGFAVVASEVRALAQRSAEAAKEIKALIQASTQQVGQGVKLVGETGESLGRIVMQFGQVHAAIAEIAASAQEQATGLHEVNTAVNQMDQVTQQNAAMVEQSTAASHSLAGETEELVRLTSQFQLGAQAEEIAAARRAPARRPAAAKAAPKATKLRVISPTRAPTRPAVAEASEDWQEF